MSELIESNLKIKTKIDALEKQLRRVNSKPTINDIFNHLKKNDFLAKNMIQKGYGPCVSKTITFIALAKRFGYDAKPVEVLEDENKTKYPIYDNGIVSHVCAEVKDGNKTFLADLTRDSFPAMHPQVHELTFQDLLSTALSNRAAHLPFNDAKAELLKAIQISPQNKDAQLNYIDLFLNNGKTGEALSLLNVAKRKFKNDALLKLHLSNVYFKLGRINDAEELIDESLSLLPINESAKTLKAAILIQKNKPIEALQVLESVSFTPHSLFHLTIANLMNGNVQRAQFSANKLIETKNIDLLKNLGKIIISKFPNATKIGLNCIEMAAYMGDDEARTIFEAMKKNKWGHGDLNPD